MSAAFASNDTVTLAKAIMKPPASINRILDIGPSIRLQTYTENWPKPNFLTLEDNLIPNPIDRNPCADWSNPMDRMG